MRWLEPEFVSQVPDSVKIALLRNAIEQRPNNAALYVRLGDLFEKSGLFSEGADAYETAARQAPDEFVAEPKLAKCYVELDRPEAALDACRRGEARGPSAELHFQKGRALFKLRRPADARDAFWSAVKANGTHIPALRALLAPMARQPDGSELLDVCDALPQSSKDTALVRAHRAIALSRIGRIAEALQIVDLDRHVARVPFDPPAQFGAIDQFNRHLADDILADRAPAKPANEGFDYNPAPQFHRSEAFIALREFIKSAIDSFLDEARDRGLDAVMPPPPKAGHLYESSTVLRGPGHNGEHIHGNAYVSSVYHVLVPDSVGSADDGRGALALGFCESYTGGYTPCWGTRYIKPVAGSLVIFPSHIFHDVVPSRTQMPRIAVAADLQPVAIV
ncbi:MAG TPA: putative 2OG-Fe(II) oxygenase [Xanthobacteraceae bacterium]|nr:putative 2OG-Fe(II) oxygenase [Xanthobacteraceae bacterium]